MTPEQLAARVLAYVRRYVNHFGDMEEPDNSYPAGTVGDWVRYADALAAIARHLAPGDDLVDRATTALEQLAPYGKQGRGSDHPQSVACRNAADTITALLARLSALTAERDSLLAGHRALNIGGARLQDRAEAAEDENARLRARLARMEGIPATPSGSWSDADA